MEIWSSGFLHLFALLLKIMANADAINQKIEDTQQWDNSNLLLRLRRQAIMNPQPWYGPIGLDRALDVPIPTNIGHFPGGNRSVSDSCPRNKVQMVDGGSCESPLTQGKCELNEEVILDPETNRGICVPRLCPLNRIFVYTTQMCHDPLDMYICPPGRELYYSAHGTPVCSCPDGTIEGDDDLDDDVCEVLLGTSLLCMPGQVFWFRDFNSPPACLQDPCNGQNLRRSNSELPYVPSDTGECIQLGSGPGVCPDNKYFSLSYSSLTGKCVTLEEAGFVILDTPSSDQLKSYFSTAQAAESTDVYRKVNISNKGEGMLFPEANNFEDFQQAHLFQRSPVHSENTQSNIFNQIQSKQVPSRNLDHNPATNVPHNHDTASRNGFFDSVRNGEQSASSSSLGPEKESQHQPSIQQNRVPPIANKAIGDNRNINSNNFPQSGNFESNFRVGQSRPSTTAASPSLGGEFHLGSSDNQFRTDALNNRPPEYTSGSHHEQFPRDERFGHTQKPSSDRQPSSQQSQNPFDSLNAHSESFDFGNRHSFPADRQQNSPSTSNSFNSQTSHSNSNTFQSASDGYFEPQSNSHRNEFDTQPHYHQYNNGQPNGNQFSNHHQNMNSFGQTQSQFGSHYGQNQHHSHHNHGFMQPISIENTGPGFNSPEVYGPGSNNQQSIELFDPYYGMRLSRSLGVQETPVKARLAAQWELDAKGLATNQRFHSMKKRALDESRQENKLQQPSSVHSSEVLSRKKRDTLPYASPSNVFETRLLGCKPGSVRDINAKCRNTILPARIPKRRGTRGAPPIPPTPSCGANMAFNIRRMCVPSSTAQRSILAFNLG